MYLWFFLLLESGLDIGWLCVLVVVLMMVVVRELFYVEVIKVMFCNICIWFFYFYLNGNYVWWIIF